LSLESKVSRRPAAVGYLARFLCLGLAVGLLATGCAGPRPLKGGKAVTTGKPGGMVEQTLVQGENASQPTKQDQESVKVRTYTVPAGSRIEQSPAPTAALGRPQPSTTNYQPSTALSGWPPSPGLRVLNRTPLVANRNYPTRRGAPADTSRL